MFFAGCWRDEPQRGEQRDRLRAHKARQKQGGGGGGGGGEPGSNSQLRKVSVCYSGDEKKGNTRGSTLREKDGGNSKATEGPV